ncbi:MAG: glycogen/starch/alpha-glucan phosphorylase [Eubacterium sp.]|nr:glycogen/starch/alpha-glucan phosphorylase [Eubacterium sp.]
MLKKTNVKEIETKLKKALAKLYSVEIEVATDEQLYNAIAAIVNDEMLELRQLGAHAVHKDKKKRVYYLCMEFLLGRSLRNNLYNLELLEDYKKVLSNYGRDMEKVFLKEEDAGLGNGGLGRLAACFMDSLASLEYPAMGYCLRYEYGLFRQKIVEGWQVELPDMWLKGGEAWLNPRYDRVFQVKFGGELHEKWTENGLTIEHTGYESVNAVPYDLCISGANSKVISILRTWRPRAVEKFDMNSFASGNYLSAMQKGINADVIGKVLYPADYTMEGKSLRLQQQYLLVSASAQDMIKSHLDHYDNLSNFADKVAIHINDTHPAMIIPELMRIFMDDYNMEWDEAFSIVFNSVSYTNHTVLSEALEVWPEVLIKRLLPRVHQIMQEINRRFCEHIWNKYPEDWGRCERMSVISYDTVRMANLSIIGSHKVNGVSKMHSEILKNRVFKDFYEDTPDKFTNVTNGIAYRRWLCQANPGLTKLIDECIGTGYKKHGEKLKDFEKYAGDEGVLHRISEIKKENKVNLSNYINFKSGVLVDPSSIFDVQVKRLHEYKRQLLNVIKILTYFYELKNNPSKEFTPQTFIFGAKAAAGYDMAKQIIKLIVSLGNEIEKDPKLAEKIRIVFMENYSVSVAEKIMPAADISEQISLAGKEASGTGNMKLMINGAVTVGTLDGANVEIADEVGKDNIYIFGMNEDEVNERLRDGYNPYKYYQENELLHNALDLLNGEIGGNNFSNMYQYLLYGNGGGADPYMCLADYSDYMRVCENMVKDYQNRRTWNKKSVINTAGAAAFTSDRSINTYAKEIWNIETF